MSYPNTYYASTSVEQKNRPALTGTSSPPDLVVDVCIVGAGIAGLSCALELIKQGCKVAVLEQESVAWGASGRNGGLVSPGWAQGADSLEAKLGLKHARSLFDLSVQGVNKIRDNIRELGLQDCDVKPGQLRVGRYPQKDLLLARRNGLAEKYDYNLAFLDRDEVGQICRSSRYHEGLFDPNAFHFHPLNYCLGLASYLESQGVVIYQQTKVVEAKVIETSADTSKVQVLTSNAQLSDSSEISGKGVVECANVVFCGGGYSGHEIPALKRAFLPIATYMVQTESLGSLASTLISKPYSICDDRRAADYYRLVEGDKILWGSRITTRLNADEHELAKLLREDITSVYPELEDVQLTRAWSGLMAYSGHKMPIVKEQQKGIWICSSFGGHGLNTGTICGTVVAQGICGGNQDYQLFQPFGCDWNGGVLGPIVANAQYRYLRVRDKIQESALFS